MSTRPAPSRSSSMLGIATLSLLPVATLVMSPAHAAPAAPLMAVLAGADHLYDQLPPPPGVAMHDIVAATPPATPAPLPPPAPHMVVRTVLRPPSLPPTAFDRASIRGIITAAALAHGVDPSWMIAIATCESGLNPRAVEPHGHYGLFQFLPSTYAGNGGHNLWDPVEQAAVTATMLAHGQAWQWACAYR